MINFCDTHGLDLPCSKCMNDRFEELEYLRKIEEDMDKFKKGQIVTRLGHATDYVVVGYNAGGMVIVTGINGDSDERELFLENNLRLKRGD